MLMLKKSLIKKLIAILFINLITEYSFIQAANGGKGSAPRPIPAYEMTEADVLKIVNSLIEKGQFQKLPYYQASFPHFPGVQFLINRTFERKGIVPVAAKGVVPVIPKAPKAPKKAAKVPVAPPKVPVTAPKAPVVAPKGPVVGPKAPVVPKGPVVTPKAPVVAPKAPVVTPKGPAKSTALQAELAAKLAARKAKDKQ